MDDDAEWTAIIIKQTKAVGSPPNVSHGVGNHRDGWRRSAAYLGQDSEVLVDTDKLMVVHANKGDTTWDRIIIFVHKSLQIGKGWSE